MKIGRNRPEDSIERVFHSGAEISETLRIGGKVVAVPCIVQYSRDIMVLRHSETVISSENCQHVAHRGNIVDAYERYLLVSIAACDAAAHGVYISQWHILSEEETEIDRRDECKYLPSRDDDLPVELHRMEIIEFLRETRERPSVGKSGGIAFGREIAVVEGIRALGNISRRIAIKLSVLRRLPMRSLPNGVS